MDYFLRMMLELMHYRPNLVIGYILKIAALDKVFAKAIVLI